MKNKNKGFTLVELLAVIVILAVILVIAIPQIMNVIKSSRISSFKDSAMLIAEQADKDYLSQQVLNPEYNARSIPCKDVAKLNDDYASCKITYNNGVAKVILKGKEHGKFDGITCYGTKDDMNCREDTELACNTEYCYLYGNSIQEIVEFEVLDDCVVNAQKIGRTLDGAEEYCNSLSSSDIIETINDDVRALLEILTSYRWGLIDITYGEYNTDIKTDWKEVKDSNGVQRPLFLKFKNDLSEKYVCTLYSSTGTLATEPTCISTDTYKTKTQANSEWSKMQTLFGSSNCNDSDSSVQCQVTDSFTSSNVISGSANATGLDTAMIAYMHQTAGNSTDICYVFKNVGTCFSN